MKCITHLAFFAFLAIAPLPSQAMTDAGDIGTIIEGFVAKQFPDAASHFWVVNDTQWDGDEMIVDMKDFAKGHWTRTIAFDPQGKKLYVGIGSASNVSPGEPKERAAINRYNPDGSGHKIFASGTRNPTTICFYPGTNTLWG